MAETFVARREGKGGVDQVVCLKRVLPAFNQDRDFVTQFQREARLAGALRHSNIVGVVDYGEVDGEQFMALELVDGVDLRSLLASRPDRKLDPELAALIALDLAYALEYAHSAQGGIVHRDLTPSNVLLSRHGEIKLADFGVAKALTGATVATATGFVKGKVPYMAPEQMRGGTVDARVDFFALGATLFECLAGRRPFVGQHDVEIMMKIIEGKRPALLEVAPDVPAELAELVERLLSPEPEGRPEDAGEVIDALAPTLENAPRARDRLAALVNEAYGEKHDEAAPADTALALEPAVPVAEPPPPSEPQPEALLPTLRAPAPSSPPPAPSSPPAPQNVAEKGHAAPVESGKRWLWAGAAALLVLGLVTAVGVALSGDEEPTAETAMAARPPRAESLPIGAELPTESDPVESATQASGMQASGMEASGMQASGMEASGMQAAAQAFGMEASGMQTATQAFGMEASGMQAAAQGSTSDPQSAPPTPMQPTTQEREGSEAAASEESASMAARTRVRVNVVPWGKVWVGHRLIGRAPQTVELPPGRHRIRAGYDSPIETRSLVLREGQSRRTVTIELPDN